MSPCSLLQAKEPSRIAWIRSLSAAGQSAYIAAFKEGLLENGLVDGRNYVLDVQFADGHYDRFPAIIDAALKRDPALSIVITISSAQAAQGATKLIPIVFVSTNDALGSGLFASLARPGATATATATATRISNQTEDVIVKNAELLHEVMPTAKSVADFVLDITASRASHD